MRYRVPVILNNISIIFNKSYYDNSSDICKSKLKQITGPDVTTVYQYDKYGNLLSTDDYYDGKHFISSYSYDDWEREVNHVYPGVSQSGQRYSTTKSYDAATGITTGLNVTGGSSIWNLNNSSSKPVDELGKMIDYNMGQNINVHYTYDYTKNNLSSKSIAKTGGYSKTYTYSWDNIVDRNITQVSTSPGTTNNYSYDSQNRLQTYTLNGGSGKTIIYTNDNNGNIDSISGLAKYGYDGTKIHFMNKFTADTSLHLTTKQQDIEYNGFNKISKIKQDSDVTSHMFNYEYRLYYDNNQYLIKSQLYKNVSGSMTLQKTKYYRKGYEAEITGSGNSITRELNYISGPDGLTAIRIKDNSTDSMYYVDKNHQGSIMALISQNGSLKEKYEYDPWGRRITSTGAYEADNVTHLIDRGYCGHEHLPLLGLINMNARMYDPMLGRFVSPDNYVQGATSVSSFNRYMYCRNNPVMYSDPSGNMTSGVTWVQTYVAGLESFNSIASHNLDMISNPYYYHSEINDAGLNAMLDLVLNFGLFMDYNTSDGTFSRSGGGGGGSDCAPPSGPKDENPTNNSSNNLVCSTEKVGMAPSMMDVFQEVNPEKKGSKSYKIKINDIAMWARELDSKLEHGGPPKIIQWIVNKNPLVSITNGIITISTGNDIYGNNVNQGKISLGLWKIVSGMSTFYDFDWRSIYWDQNIPKVLKKTKAP